ncbi:MAG: DUF3987 domain-containing protein [Deltaproteobacteria bacterium]|nr:DUF3987 domain-containing protein [Deltaproteobacteria bacterium]
MGDLPSIVPLPSLLPRRGILPYYVSEARKLTGAPDIYHLASILTVFGALLDPIACGYVVWPNGLFRRERLFLWMLLIGPSGNKKTYSTELAVKACGDHLGPRIRNGEGGRRALEDMLIAERYPLVWQTEAASWFANNRQGYMVEGASFWTQVYDGHYAPRPRSGESESRERFKVGVSLLIMGPEDEILRSTRRSDWKGGLMPRLNICRAGRMRRGRGKGAEWPPAVLAVLDRGIKKMLEVAAGAKYLRLTREARETWESWQYRHERKMATVGDLHEGLAGRLPWHVLRIASIYAASRFSTIVERRDVIPACNFGLLLRRGALSFEPKV